MLMLQKMLSQQRNEQDQEFMDDMQQPAPHFVSAQPDMLSMGGNIAKKPLNVGPLVDGTSDKSGSQKGSRKEGTSQFGLKSNTAETVNALAGAATANQDVRSIAIDEGDTAGTGTITPSKGLLPPISGDRSDGAVFRGLNNSGEGSGGLLGSHSQMEKVEAQKIEIQGQNTADANGDKVPESAQDNKLKT